MLYHKNILKASLFVTICLSAVFAADVAPMYFEGKTGDEHQAYWDTLMTFKAWGTQGFSMYSGKMPDTSGSIGTAKGNIFLGADEIQLGGKILSGKDLVFKSGAGTLIKGPVRTIGNFTSGTNGYLSYEGTYCIEGSADEGAKKGIANKGGLLFEGAAAKEKTGKCSYENVSAVPTTLNVPKIDDASKTYNKGIDVSGSDTVKVHYIDVPKINEGEGKLWDLYYESISIHNGGELRVRMPHNGGGRLVRIFLNHAIDFYAGAKLRVEYVNEDAVYQNGQWTNVRVSPTAESNDTTRVLTHEEYAGNLLVYMKDDVKWDAFHDSDFVQGSLVTQGTMEVGSNLRLAGQLIADSLKINAEFNSSDFRYVPFDPAVLDPELFTVRDFEESGVLVEVPVRLDTNTLTDVYFDYCFELTDEKPVDGKTSDARADISDFDSIPNICGSGTGHVTILAGSKYPVDSTKIYINVKLDRYKEVYGTSRKESFNLKVFNMVGAVLKNNKKEGSFTLNILDKNIFPETRDTSFTIAEDDTIRFDAGMFPYYSLIESEFKGVRVESVPDTSNGKLTYKGELVKDNQMIPVDSLGDLIYVPKKDSYGSGDDFNFSSLKFSVVDANDAVSSKDKDPAGNLIGAKEFVINVTPVNDAPVVKPADFTISGHVIKGGEDVVLKGKIDVKDVDDTSFTYIFDPDDENFAVVDSLFAIDKNTGAIYVKPGVELNRNVADSLYTINVIVSDKSESTGDTNDILSAVSKVTLKIDYANHAPTIDTDKVRIPENSKPGTETDSTLKASDKDVGDTSKIFELVGKSDNFDVSKDGVISVKPGAKLDYDKSKSDTITVKVCDEYGDCTTKKVVVEIMDINVEIVKGENDQNKWEKPSGTNSWVIKTNDPSMKLTCTFDDSKKTWNDFCKDTTLVEGCYYYDVVFGDTLFAGVAHDSVKICYSSAAPVVKVTTDDNNVGADNIYTIVEGTDSKDTSYYVNSPKKNITVSVIDTVTGERQNFSVGLDLDTVGVDKKSLAVINAIREKSDFKRDEDRLSEKTPVNGEYIKVTYKDSTLDRIPVNITYMTDKNGEPLKVPVETSKGKIDSIEVITVTYVTKINGRDVSISYKADAITGSVLMVNSQGNLMYESAKENKQAAYYTVSYDYVDSKGKSANVSYVIDNDGSLLANGQGDIGYNVSYTYKNEFGNSATGSVFIVLDRKGPKVEIVSPANGEVIRATFVDVVWKVDGVKQDTLSVQSLKKGLNQIVRFYKDKAGNMAADTIMVLMKDAKDIELEVEQPVTVVTKDKVEEYYAANPPKKGQTFAVSIRNPKTGEEFETKIGGTFKTEEGSLKAPYPDVSDSTHLGPTLAMRIKVPQASNVGGLATLDDLVINGKVNLSGVDAAEGEKVSVEDYVDTYCPDLNLAQDSNLYDIEMKVDIWIYTSLGNFVDKYSFTQNIDDPAYVNDVGLLDLYFELKPDEEGYVRTESGRLYATGAYVYKVDVKMKSTPRCVLPPVRDNADKVGNPIKTDDYLLKSFGYKRPNW